MPVIASRHPGEAISGSVKAAKALTQRATERPLKAVPQRAAEEGLNLGKGTVPVNALKSASHRNTIRQTHGRQSRKGILFGSWILDFGSTCSRFIYSQLSILNCIF
jgi:hypothetical protein